MWARSGADEAESSGDKEAENDGFRDEDSESRVTKALRRENDAKDEEKMKFYEELGAKISHLTQKLILF